MTLRPYTNAEITLPRPTEAAYPIRTKDDMALEAQPAKELVGTAS
jgi:hypothetical protein